MPDQRKSIHTIKSEYDDEHHLYGKSFHHHRSKEDYQLLFPVWDEATNTKQAVYCLSAMPWLKFVRPWDEFRKSFIEGSAMSADNRQAAE